MLKTSKPIILSSGSPRRKQLLNELGLSFEVVPYPIDESIPKDILVEKSAEYLAGQKALAWPEGDAKGKVIITADTVVVYKNQILAKPSNTEEAVRMLKQLNTTIHKVISGFSIRIDDYIYTDSSTTLVYFKNLTEVEIDYYVSHFKPFDKAGAYGIQEWIGLIGVEKIEGDYFNVVGLPINKLYASLVKLGIIERSSYPTMI